MKICFFTTTVYKDGGVSRVLSALASALAEKYDVTIVTFDNRENENRRKYGLSDKVNVYFMNPIYKKCYVRRGLHKINQKTGLIKKLNMKSVWDFVYIPKKMQKSWVEYIQKNHFDVVIGVQGKLAYTLGSISDKLQCKTIGWQHNSYEAYLEQKGKEYYWNQDFLFEKYIPKLDYYVVLNKHDQVMFKKKKNIECITIYNPRSFVSKEKALLEIKRFIGVGGLRRAKGFDLLIDSFDSFSKKDKEWCLDIFGLGPEKDNLQHMIDNKGLSNRVHLQGITEDICGEMLKSSALLLSSRWEGMPMVVLEALETGLPVVAYDITAVEPLVNDGMEGIIVHQFNKISFANAMLQISQDSNMRKQIGLNATKKSEHFDINIIVEQWENLFI